MAITKNQNEKKSAKEKAPEKRPSGGFAHWPLSLGVLVTLFVIDHLTKFWAEKALKPEWWGVFKPTLEMWESRPAIPIIPGYLQFVYAENTGAAFSMLDGHVTLLGIISVAATIGLFFFWKSLPADEVWGRIAIAVITSGAIGNMIDRLFRGFVVDFIDAYIGRHHWPTFNVADSSICVGAVILIILYMRGRI